MGVRSLILGVENRFSTIGLSCTTVCVSGVNALDQHRLGADKERSTYTYHRLRGTKLTICLCVTR